MSSNRKHSIAVSQSSSLQPLILERLDRSIGSDFIARDHRFRMFETGNTSRYFSPSACSIESFADDTRHPARATLTKIFNRRRSFTVSTSSSSTETATNGVTAPIALTGKSSDTPDKASSHQSCINRMQTVPSLNALGDPVCERDQLATVSNPTDSCYSAYTPALSTAAHHALNGRRNSHDTSSRTGHIKIVPADSTLEVGEAEDPSTRTQSTNSDLTPLLTGPRLIHRSSPPWEVSGRDESRSQGSGSRFGPDDQTNEGVYNNTHLRQGPQSKAGLKKLFKSVKVSLWSTPSTSSVNDFVRKTHDDKVKGHCPQHSLLSSNQSSISEDSVDAQSTTTLARSRLNHFSAVDPDDSIASLSRSVSAHSIFSIDTATTSTIASASITPSSSWSSLPAPQSDCPMDASELGRHPDMATPHTLAYTHPASRSFDSSFGLRNIHNSQDHSPPTRVLKTKPSFGFLHNLKRAITGADPTLSFSFHNHLTPSLTTSAVSLPVGTVLRNNGLDPLPPCHPLPTSQSSPSNFEFSFSVQPGLEPQRFDSVQSPRALSLFSSGLEDYSNIPRSDVSYIHEPISPTETLGVPPTLNLRPISMPFADSFSDHFLFNGSKSTNHQEQDSGHQPEEKSDEETCDHRLHCPCCRSLSDENIKLVNRIKELEIFISKSASST